MNYKLLDTDFTIGERLRNIRENLGYTRESFAEILDISPATLSNVELGRTHISQIILINLYKVFGISSDEILLGIKKTDTMQNKINRIISDLNKDKLKYIYKVITTYVSYHK